MMPSAFSALAAAAFDRCGCRVEAVAVTVRRCFMLLEMAAEGFRFGIVPTGADVTKLASRIVRGAVVRVPRGLIPA